MAAKSAYTSSVFINCPFDEQYTPIFEAIVFAVMACGFQPTSARQRLNSAEVRIEKISSLIQGARFSIHDLSRTTLDHATGYPRFNMPFELGVDFGCRRFSPKRKNKSALIFVEKKWEYRKFLSDIAGQDPEDHENDPVRVITSVRNFLVAESGRSLLPGPKKLAALYQRFRVDLPAMLADAELEIAEMTFVDLADAIKQWLVVNAANPVKARSK